MNSTPTSPSKPDAWPTFDQACDLHARATALSRAPTADASADLLALRGLIDQGWTPYLHDYVGSRMSPPILSSALFSDHPRSAALFEELCTVFPATLQSWTLLARSASTTTPSRSALVLTAQSSNWAPLRPAQKIFLVDNHSELIGLPTHDPSSIDLWIKCAFSVLGEPPTDDASRSCKPFYGYFESTHWKDLLAGRPSLAWSLAVSLCCSATIDPELPFSSAWMARALDASIEARALDRSCALEGASARLAHACLDDALASDRPDSFSTIALAIGSDWAGNEADVFAKLTPENKQLKEFIDPSGHYRPSAFINYTRRGSHKHLTRSEALSDRALNQRALSNNSPTHLPLHTLCAIFGSERCWHALEAIAPAPFDTHELAMHPMRLPSPIEIKRRLAMHMERTQAPNSAIMLQTNLEREEARAKRILASLPLPASLRRALDGQAEADEAPRPSAILLRDRFDPAAREFFDKECAKAQAKALSGRPACLAVPARVDWATMAITLGAKPAFLLGKMPAGALARSCACFELLHSTGLHARFHGEDIAAIEADELAEAVTGPQTSRKVRL